MFTLAGDLNNRYWIGLSTDTKPSPTSTNPNDTFVINGMPLYEMDTGKIYLFDASNNQWVIQ